METAFASLVGKTLKRVDAKKYAEVVTFETVDGEIYRQYHSQDCCENVSVEDITGELEDIIASPILQAEESSNSGEVSEYGDSSTWTFYRIATMKGQVVIRWLGTSNGYYSESVSFEKIDN